MVILLLVMDLIFYLFIAPSWMATQLNNDVWNGLHGIHGFAIFLSVIISLLKIPLLYFLHTLRKSLDTSK